MLHWTTEAEQQQLLPKESGLSSQQQKEDISMAHVGDEDEHRESSFMRSFLVGPLAFITVGLVVWLAFTGFVVVPPGELAVVVTLGHVNVYLPGPHFRTPFVSTVHSMSTKTQLISEKNNIPTKEGLSVSLDVALLYRIDPNMAGDLFQNVGVDYAQVLIEPEAASVIRGLTSESDAKALYSSGRHEIQDKVREELDQTLRKMGIIIESVMLKDLELPESLSKAIEQKAKAEQESVMMEFVLTKEKQEAERKAIEARGIADFQKIVSEDISDQTLRWKGIEATEKLVSSPNAKIIIMGNGKGDLPVILNGDV
ncbi:hypothetical protein ACHAXN_006646 [Cyclotella atomus]